MRFVISIVIENTEDDVEDSIESVGAVFVDQGDKINLGSSVDFQCEVLHREIQIKSPHVCEIRYRCRRSS